MHTQILTLMQSAETLFPGKSGKQKKQWVIAQAMDLKKSWNIDIPLISGVVEDALVRAILSAVVEVIWGLVFAKKPVEG